MFPILTPEPQPILPLAYNPFLYCDANFPNGFGGALPPNNDPLTPWVNLAGGVVNVTQGNSANRPRWQNNAAVGGAIPGIRFDGSNDVYNVIAGSGTAVYDLLAPTQSFTTIICFRRTSLGSDDTILGTRGSAATIKLTIGVDASDNCYSSLTSVFGAGTLISAPLTDTNAYHILTTINDGTGANIRQILDGVPSVSVTGTPSSVGVANNTFLGAGASTGLTAPFNGFMGNVFMCRGVLPQPAIDNITRYFANQKKVRL